MFSVVDRSSQFVEPPVPIPGGRVFATREQQRLAVALFDQQLWCLGRDIRHPAGDLLARSGLCRHPRRAEHAGSCGYTGRFGDRASVSLWGFGAFFGRAGLGGVYIHRFDFHPMITATAELSGVDAPADLPPVSPARTAREWRTVRDLTAGLLLWFAGYEHWVAESCGIAWRTRCLAERGKTPAVAAARMAGEWESLARRSRELAFRGDATGPWAELLDDLRRQIAFREPESTEKRR